MMWTAVTIWWKTAAQPWLKRYWQYLLIPLGLLAIWLRPRKAPQVVTSEQAGAGEAGLEATKDYEEASWRAQQAAVRALEAEQQKRDVALNQLEADAKTIPDLQQDPAKANVFLKDVGKKMRED